jgi:hypothetical protein
LGGLNQTKIFLMLSFVYILKVIIQFRNGVYTQRCRAFKQTKRNI